MSEILTYKDPVSNEDLFSVLAGPQGADLEYRLMLIRQGLELLNKPTTNFTFEAEEGGKPYLLMGKDRVEISLSHTKDQLVVVVSKSARVGIDIEHNNRVVSERLQKRIFCELSECEIEPIRLWTIKEAFLKMTGSGLRVGMNKVRVKHVSNNLYEASTQNEHAWVFSFLWEKKYISVAWDKFPGEVA